MSSPELSIRISSLLENFRIFKKLASEAKCFPVLKANAYGVGAFRVAEKFCNNFAIQGIFVATVAEGVALRLHLESKGYHPIIYVLEGLGGVKKSLHYFYESDLSPILNSLDDVIVWENSNSPPGLPFGIQVNLGFNRFGLDLQQLEFIKTRIKPSVVLSHLSCASLDNSPTNLLELNRFKSIRSLFPEAQYSLSASAGIFLGKEYHFDIVRPGAGLYGPFLYRQGPWNKLQNVCKMSAQIFQVRDIPEGSCVGYDATWCATSKTRIATITAGYADGLSSRWRDVSLGVDDFKKRFSIVGRISMDACMIDLRDDTKLQPGDRVELFSDHYLPVKLADQLGISMQELLTAVGNAPRVLKNYY